LPFGSVRPWAVLTLQIVTALLAGLAAYHAASERTSLSTRHWLLLAGVSLIPCVAFAQLLATAWIQGAGSPRAVTAFLGTIAPPDTFDALARALSAPLLTLVVFVAIRTPLQRRTLWTCVIVAAAFQALYGLLEFSTGHQHIFAYHKRFYTDSATGTFINRNHFAIFVAATLPLLIAGMSPPPYRALAQYSRERSTRAFPIFIRSARYVAIAVFAVAILASFSRAGAVLGLTAATAAASLSLSQRRVSRMLLASIGVSLIMLVLWQDRRDPAERWIATADLGIQNESRLVVWDEIRRHIASAPASMAGLGAFDGQFANLRPGSLRSHWDHAHSEPLQLAYEVSAAIAVPLLISLALAAWACLRQLQRDPSWTYRVPALVALGVLLCHSLVDFPLRIPALAFLATVLAASALGPDDGATSTPLSGLRLASE
jgi:hypothetical protein